MARSGRLSVESWHCRLELCGPTQPSLELLHLYGKQICHKVSVRWKCVQLLCSTCFFPIIHSVFSVLVAALERILGTVSGVSLCSRFIALVDLSCHGLRLLAHT